MNKEYNESLLKYLKSIYKNRNLDSDNRAMEKIIDKIIDKYFHIYD